MSLEVVWNGSMRDVYLCVREPRVLKSGVEIPAPQVRTQSAPVDEALAIMGTAAWKTSDLAAVLGLDNHTLGTWMWRWTRAGLVERVGCGVYRRKASG